MYCSEPVSKGKKSARYFLCASVSVFCQLCPVRACYMHASPSFIVKHLSTWRAEGWEIQCGFVQSVRVGDPVWLCSVCKGGRSSVAVFSL